MQLSEKHEQHGHSDMYIVACLEVCCRLTRCRAELAHKGNIITSSAVSYASSCPTGKGGDDTTLLVKMSPCY